MEQHLLSYYIGIFLVLATHVYILMYPSHSIMNIETHAYVNIAAALCIAYYFMNKENYIKF